MQILQYQTANGKNPFKTWLTGLRDLKAKVTILRRVDRLPDGQFGACRYCRNGVWELKIDTGPGYRVYYSQTGTKIILLLCGGSKRTQTRDIARAVAYWKDYQERL